MGDDILKKKHQEDTVKVPSAGSWGQDGVGAELPEVPVSRSCCSLETCFRVFLFPELNNKKSDSMKFSP